MRSFIPTDDPKTRRREGMNLSRQTAGAVQNYIISSIAGRPAGRYNGAPSTEFVVTSGGAAYEMDALGGAGLDSLGCRRPARCSESPSENPVREQSGRHQVRNGLVPQPLRRLPRDGR